MGFNVRASALVFAAVSAVVAAAPASAAVTGTKTVNLTPLGNNVYAAAFDALVSAGSGSYVFNLVFPTAGTGSLSYSSTVRINRGTSTGVAITGATLGTSTLDLDTASNRNSTTYSGGGDFNLTGPITLPLTLDYSSPTGGAFTGNLTFSAVPEPASWALMIGGFGLVGGAMRRRSVRSVKTAFAA